MVSLGGSRVNSCMCAVVTSREYERAASLAEKYCDFSTLIEICEELNAQERLWCYMDQFKDSVRRKQLNQRVYLAVSVNVFFS